ncbi:HD domain-containing protein [Desulfobulbus oligotrophicus]|uniref:HD domain-containing protein n=1 Tax=Desulfobulbus oligotrophicus TaxID=1909699 RepID=A0A7T6APR1_9BACT|nr:hypothetical protein [Desulfobulbus oligotrophicus]QQG64640.1 hypothetical protein HP555_01565 [Desulfobulbus oligotrophicus]
MVNIVSNELITAVQYQFQVDWNGIHGVSHWARVYENGLHLAESTGANKQVVRLFAVFHDSRRFSEGQDLEHGPRGAQLAKLYRGKYYQLPDDEFDLLFTACSLHTQAKTHVDSTVQTCFDGDRLDLARVGKIPDPRFLCTEAARDPKTIEWAIQRSITGFVPKNILGQTALEGQTNRGNAGRLAHG